MPSAEPRRQRGLTWQELAVGTRFETLARTVTEADQVGFVTSMGLFEGLFLDARDTHLGGSGRVVPGALTFAMAEGLVVQTQFIQGTGRALLGVEMKMLAPVVTGDTIQVRFEVTESRPTSDGERGIVKTRNEVVREDGEVVLEYTPARLVAGSHHRRGG